MDEANFIAAYEQLALAAAQSKKEENHLCTRSVALVLGMTEEAAHRQMDNYVLRQSDWELVYCWRYYDTSQVFSPGPDRNILSVTLLKSGNVIKSTTVEWMD